MNAKSGLSFGDYDSDSIHRSDFVHSDIYRPNALNSSDIQINTEFVALNDFDPSQPNRYVEPEEPDPLMQEIMNNGINGLSQEQKDELLRRHLSRQIMSMKDKDDDELNHRRETKKLYQKWAKILLVLTSVILLFSLVAVITTIIYTSITTGTMSETGIASAIISFFAEIIRTLIGS